jgi:hypothetical protein
MFPCGGAQSNFRLRKELLEKAIATDRVTSRATCDAVLLERLLSRRISHLMHDTCFPRSLPADA